MASFKTNECIQSPCLLNPLTSPGIEPFNPDSMQYDGLHIGGTPEKIEFIDKANDEQIEMIKQYSSNLQGPIGSMLEQFEDVKSDTDSDIYQYLHHDQDQASIHDAYEDDQIISLEDRSSIESILGLDNNDMSHRHSPIHHNMRLHEENSPYMILMNHQQKIDAPNTPEQIEDSNTCRNSAKKRDLKKLRKHDHTNDKMQMRKSRRSKNKNCAKNHIMNQSNNEFDSDVNRCSVQKRNKDNLIVIKFNREDDSESLDDQQCAISKHQDQEKFESVEQEEAHKEGSCSTSTFSNDKEGAKHSFDQNELERHYATASNSGSNSIDLEPKVYTSVPLKPHERQAVLKRYFEKKKNRRWKKRINYATRKEVADVRPRYKGRFVTNEQYDEYLRVEREKQERKNRMKVFRITKIGRKHKQI